MEQKYKIRSANTIIAMVVTFADESNEVRSVAASIDMANDRVFFSEHLEGIDYVDLEQEILKFLRPEGLQAPRIPPEVVKQIADMRRGVFEGEKINQKRS